MTIPPGLRAIVAVLCLARLAAAESHLYEEAAGFDKHQHLPGIIAELGASAAGADLSPYLKVLALDARGRINEHTYVNYGLVPAPGHAIVAGSVTAEAVAARLLPGTADLRPLRVDLDGTMTDTRRIGLVVHLVYTAQFSWTETGPEGPRQRSVRREIETHHLLYPWQAVLAIAAGAGLAERPGVVINATYYPLR